MNDFILCRIAAILILSPIITANAQEAKEVLRASGASSLEELDESEYERVTTLLQRKVHINSATRRELLSCGLFTTFQTASILDYRARSGDILSLSELARVDGFREETVQQIRDCISLDSRATPGFSSERSRDLDEIMLRAGGKFDAGASAAAMAGIKYRHTADGRWSLSAAARSSYAEPLWPPQDISLSFTKYGKRTLGKLIIGDYNARFGQGLALWSGFSLSGFSSEGAFSRRASGITPAWTFSPGSCHTGAAADFLIGRRTTISTMVSFPGLRAGNPAILAAANASVIALKGEISLTIQGCAAGNVLSGKAALGGKWSPGKWDLSTEAAVDLASGAIAAVAGARWNPRYQHSCLLTARHYSASFSPEWSGGVRAGSKTSDETGIAAGIRIGSLTATLDAALFPAKKSFQYKALCFAPLKLGESWTLTPRLSVRYKYAEKSPWRADARIEAEWAPEPWLAKIRAEATRSRSWGFLTYAEAGRKTPKSALYLRGTIFHIDNWDDRIYVYERDAPGSFNVPSYYGRGGALSAVCSLKWERRGPRGIRKSAVHLRVSALLYSSDKPGRLEAKIQYNLSL